MKERFTVFIAILIVATTTWKGIPNRTHLNVDNTVHKTSFRNVVYLGDERNGLITSLGISQDAKAGTSRHIRSFRTMPTDVTQLYDDVDSEDYAGIMEKTDTHCRPPQYQVRPTCNDIHSMNLVDDLLPSNTSFILSTKGFWRYVWILTPPTGKPLVFKTFRFEHAFEEAYYEHQQVDAFVMERFSSSPYILDIYNSCGLSVVTELVEEQLSHVFDKLQGIHRLKLAKQVADGIAALHHANVVHNDLNQANVAYSSVKNAPVLFDFNIAVLGKECPFESKYLNPQWRAPEEQEMGTLLTEKVDIYALGNIFFRFVFGSIPWGTKLSSEQKDTIAKEKSRNGMLPPLPSLPSNDTATKALIEIMYQCYSMDPNMRPTAGQISNSLQATILFLSSMTKPRQRFKRRPLKVSQIKNSFAS
jgi:Protein kinase domain